MMNNAVGMCHGILGCEQMKFRANSGFRKLTSDAAGAGAKIS